MRTSPPPLWYGTSASVKFRNLCKYGVRTLGPTLVPLLVAGLGSIILEIVSNIRPTLGIRSESCSPMAPWPTGDDDCRDPQDWVSVTSSSQDLLLQIPYTVYVNKFPFFLLIQPTGETYELLVVSAAGDWECK
jgi:hypothetical protein